MALPKDIRAVISKYMDAFDITAKSHQIFHKGASPKVGKNLNVVLTRVIDAINVVSKTR